MLRFRCFWSPTIKPNKNGRETLLFVSLFLACYVYFYTSITCVTELTPDRNLRAPKSVDWIFPTYCFTILEPRKPLVDFFREKKYCSIATDFALKMADKVGRVLAAGKLVIRPRNPVAAAAAAAVVAFIHKCRYIAYHARIICSQRCEREQVLSRPTLSQESEILPWTTSNLSLSWFWGSEIAKKSVRFPRS